MQKDGKYIYCIIASNHECNFGPIGLGGRGDLVTTIGYEGLCMVVSDHPLNKFVVNPENILAHQKVIEVVMSEFKSVIPVRFGTIAAAPDEIRNLLNRRYGELSEMLKDFEDIVEYNIKGVWKKVSIIYKEIDDENAGLQKLRHQIEKCKDGDRKNQKIIEAGNIVAEALEHKKAHECDEIVSAFRRSVAAAKNNKTTGEAMFMNTAFLVNRGREVEFDDIMKNLGSKFEERADFYYTGPLPVFNFVDLRILPEKWEL